MAQQIGPITAATQGAWTELGTILEAFRSDFNIDRVTFAAALESQNVPMLASYLSAVGQGMTVSLTSTGLLESGQVTGGNDFFFSPSDGTLEVNEKDYVPFTTHQDNTLYMGAGITPDMVNASVDAQGDLVLTVGSNGDAVQLDAQTLAPEETAYALGANGVQSVVFTNGVTWDDSGSIVGSADDTNLVALSAGTTFDTAGYATSVEGFGVGNTILFGKGYGHVSVNLNGGSGVVQFGSGIAASDLSFSENIATGSMSIGIDGQSDVLTISQETSGFPVRYVYLTDGSSIDLSTLTFDATGTQIGTYAVLSGGTYTYQVAGGQSVQGGPGYDTFNMGPDTTAVGGPDINNFYYATGDGNVTIYPGSGHGNVELSDPSLLPSDLTFSSASNGDLIISDGHSGDQLTIKGDLSNTDGAVSSLISDIVLANGDYLSASALTFQASESQDGILSSDSFGNTNFDVSGGISDVVTGSFLNRIYMSERFGTTYVTMNDDGGRGVEVFLGAGLNRQGMTFQSDATGDLTVTFSSGDSLVLLNDLSVSASTVSSTAPWLEFADGSSLLLNQYLTYELTVGGGAIINADPYGATLFSFASGGGTAVGGQFSNAYQFGVGDGDAVIQTGSGSNTLNFGPGLTASELSCSTDAAGDLVIAIAGDAADQITIKNDLSLSGGTPQSAIAAVNFSNGSYLSLTSSLMFTATVSGGATVTGTNFGGNTFSFGTGGGEAIAGSFADTYSYNVGDGAAVVELAPHNNDNQSVVLGQGITSANILFATDAEGDLTISSSGDTVDTLTILNALAVGIGGAVTSPLWSLETGNDVSIYPGSQTLTFQQSVAAGATVAGTLFGSSDFLFQSGGGTAIGGQDVNTFVFASGGDTAVAAGKADNFYWGLGDGATTISSSGSTLPNSQVFVGSGVPASQLVYSSDANGDLTITVKGDASDSLTIEKDFGYSSYYQSWQSQVSDLQLANGSEVSLTNLNVTEQVGGGATVEGVNWGSNTFDFGAGGGTAVAGTGVNSFNFGLGDGAATIQLSSKDYSQQTLTFGVGISASSLLFSADAVGDVVISIQGDTQDTLTIDKDLYKGTYGELESVINDIQLANGSFVYFNNQTYTSIPSPMSVTVASPVVEVGGTTASLTGISLTDPNNSSSVTATLNFSPQQGWLWDGDGLGVTTWNWQTGQYQLTITGSLAAVNADLATLNFYAYQTGAANITVSATDNLGAAATAETQDISVVAPPPPALTITMPQAVTVALGDTVALPGLSFTDSNSTDDVGFEVYDAYGTVSVAPGATVQGSDSGSYVMLNGSVSDVQAELATLHYTASTSTNMDWVYGYAWDDQGGNSYAWGQPTPVTTVTVLPVALAVLATPYSQQAWAGDTIQLPQAFKVDEADASADLTAIISTTGGSLFMDNGSTDLSGQQLQVTGDAQQLNAELGSLSMSDSIAETDTLTMSVTDSDGNSASNTTSVSVESSDPVISLAQALASAIANTQGFYDLYGTSVGDADTSATFTATLSVTDGSTLTLNELNDWWDATGAGSGTSNITLNGSMWQLNNSLNDIGFNSGALGTNPVITLTITDNHGETATASTAPIPVVGSGLSVTAIDSGESMLLGNTYQQTSATYFSTNWATIDVPNEVVTATISDALADIGPLGQGLFVPTAQSYGPYAQETGPFSFASLVSENANSITIQGSALNVTLSLECMIYKPTVAGNDTIGVSLTDNHGGSAEAASNITVVTSQLGISNTMAFTADPNQPTPFSAQMTDTSSLGWSGDDITVDMFAGAGALSLPGMNVLPNGGVEIQGSLGVVNWDLSQGVYVANGNSSSDTITMLARDNHGGAASALIPISINLPTAA